MATILIIDDEKAIRKTLTEILTFEGYKIEEAADGEEGLKKFREKTFDVVLENSDKIDNTYANNSDNRRSHQSDDEISSQSPYNDSSVDHFSNYYSIGDLYSKSQKAKITATNTLDIPKGRYQIIVEPSLCLAFGSCETLAPKVFVVEKDKPINPKAVVISETGTDFETILDAAKTCPTKAIIIVDRYSGERVYP